MNQLDLPTRAPDRNVEALSLDAKWVADRLSEYGFKMADLELLYPAAETVATEWAARGDALISIDLVTGEMRRRFHLKFSNTVRPFLARMSLVHQGPADFPPNLAWKLVGRVERRRRCAPGERPIIRMG